MYYVTFFISNYEIIESGDEKSILNSVRAIRKF